LSAIAEEGPPAHFAACRAACDFPALVDAYCTMTPEERDLINGLFDRLRAADNAQKDREAEQLIQARVAQQPSAPYLLAQTVLVQEHALNNAQSRIAQLERQLAAAQQEQPRGGSGGGSFLSGLFGGGHSSTPEPPQDQRRYQQQPPPLPSGGQPPYPSTMNMPQSAGGGFLRTALAAAAGVAGGSLLMHGFQNLLGHNAGPFASSMGSMGGGFMPTGGGPDIIENRETINNYYNTYEGNPGQDSPDRAASNDGLFGGGGSETQDFQETGHELPPTDPGTNPDSDYDSGGDIPPTDDFTADADTGSAFDDSGADAGFDSGGFDGGSSGGDDSSYV
jgi:hypothetical protein